MPTYDFFCPVCVADSVLHVKKDERDRQFCSVCGEMLEQVYRKFPGVTNASYIDGKNKQNTGIKEAAWLKSKAFNYDPGSDERKGLLKEAAKKEKE